MLRDETLLPLRAANAAPNAAGITRADLADATYSAAVRAGAGGCLAEGEPEVAWSVGVGAEEQRGMARAGVGAGGAAGAPGDAEGARPAAHAAGQPAAAGIHLGVGDFETGDLEAGDLEVGDVEAGDRGARNIGVEVALGAGDEATPVAGVHRWDMPEPAGLASASDLVAGNREAREGSSVGIRLAAAARSHPPAPFSENAGPGAGDLGVEDSMTSHATDVPPQPYRAALDHAPSAAAVASQGAATAAQTSAQNIAAPVVPTARSDPPTIAGSSAVRQVPVLSSPLPAELLVDASGATSPAAGYSWLPAAGYSWMLGVGAVLAVMALLSRVGPWAAGLAPPPHLRPSSRTVHRVSPPGHAGASAPPMGDDLFSPAKRVSLLPRAVPEPVWGWTAVRAARSIRRAVLTAVNAAVKAAAGDGGHECFEEEVGRQYMRVGESA